MLRLSIIIPVYNVEKYLDQCVSSLFRQGLDENEFEVLLIDDGSTDSSLEISHRWLKIHNNIHVYHQKNQGQAVARNWGIENAKGEYLMFVDSDDYLYENSLFVPMRLISENDYDCIHFVMGIEREDGSVSPRRIDSAKYGQTYSGKFVALNFNMYGSICSYIFKSDLFKATPLRFKSGFVHEDCELWFRLVPKICKIYFYNGLVYHYRFNTNSTDRSLDLNSIKRKYNSDLLVAAELNKLIHNGDLSAELKKHYTRIQNSLVVSHHRAYLQNPKLFPSKNYYYAFVRNLGLLPSFGFARSFRSTLYLHYINLKFLLHKHKITIVCEL